MRPWFFKRSCWNGFLDHKQRRNHFCWYFPLRMWYEMWQPSCNQELSQSNTARERWYPEDGITQCFW
jgi:hypothetical protein